MTFSQTITDQLTRPLDQSRVKTRSSRGGSLSYIEGYDVIDSLNSIFGYDGWHMDVRGIQQFGPVIQAIVNVTVFVPDHIPASRTDVGAAIPAGDSNEALETAIKAAVTDGMKRAARTFGNQFGNSLYDKDSPLHAASGNTNRPSIPGSAPAFQRPAANNGASAGSAAPPSGVGRPASVRQVNFARSLAREQSFDVDKYAGVEYGGLTLDQLTSTQISAVIEYLQRRVAGGPGEAPAAPQRPAPRRAASASTDDVPF